MDFSSQWFWYTLGLVFIIFEMLIPGTFLPSIFFASAFITGLAANLISNVFILVLIFAFSSILLIIFAKPFLESKFRVNKDGRDSNIDALIGKKGKIISIASFEEKGVAIFEGEEWTVQPEDPKDIFDVDTIVEIVSITGVTAIVKKA